jgi:hypothetical protein
MTAAPMTRIEKITNLADSQEESGSGRLWFAAG